MCSLVDRARRLQIALASFKSQALTFTSKHWAPRSFQPRSMGSFVRTFDLSKSPQPEKRKGNPELVILFFFFKSAK